MKPEIIGTLHKVAVLIDRQSQEIILGTQPPMKFSVDHPYIQGTKLERDARAALAQPRKLDRGPCMYDDGIVAADDTCLRCGAKSGEDCRDI